MIVLDCSYGETRADIDLLPCFLPIYKNLLPTMDVIFTTYEIPRPIYTSVIYYSLYCSD